MKAFSFLLYVRLNYTDYSTSTLTSLIHQSLFKYAMIQSRQRTIVPLNHEPCFKSRLTALKKPNHIRTAELFLLKGVNS